VVIEILVLVVVLFLFPKKNKKIGDAFSVDLVVFDPVESIHSCTS
jgi:hypothetical protein